jgi:hypothetical protein
MEGKVRIVRLYRRLLMIGAGSILFCAPGLSRAQAPAPAAPAVGQAELNLRKSVNTREFRGQEVQGEDRQIGRGDTLWRILVEEKGLSGKKFRSYLVVIRGLNPQVKNLDVLRVGDKIFIPLRVDQLLEERPPTEPVGSTRPQPGADVTTNYRVKPGEHLYQILREQLKITDDRKLAQYYALVKDLNPERKNWDTLLEGDILRLPVVGRAQEITARAPPAIVESKRPTEPIARAETKSAPEVQSTVEAKPSVQAKLSGEAKPTAEVKSQAEVKPVPEAKTSAAAKPTLADRRPSLRAPATENMTLFATVVEAMGGQMQQSGEEVVVLKEGTVRFDKSSYPVVYSPALGQKVVIDPNDKIPASLRTKLGDPTLATQVLPMANGLSIQEAVSQLLARLGYQPLSTDRPVVVQEEGIAFEAKGNWIALAPEHNNRTQEIVVINLTDEPSEIPDYLKAQLAKKGLHLRDVAYPSPALRQSPPEAINAPKELTTQAKNWPPDKREMVDSVLLSFGITFGVGETLSVELRDGLRVDARIDRLFEQGGKRTALFFQRTDPEIKRALQDKQGVRAVELEIGSLSSRELVDKVLSILGHQASYREHRFAAANGAAQDRLTVTAWGFHLPQRSMFVTDRQIPAVLYRFFFEKGLEIVYFQ